MFDLLWDELNNDLVFDVFGLEPVGIPTELGAVAQSVKISIAGSDHTDALNGADRIQLNEIIGRLRRELIEKHTGFRVGSVVLAYDADTKQIEFAGTWLGNDQVPLDVYFNTQLEYGKTYYP